MHARGIIPPPGRRMEEGSTKVLHAVFPAWFSLDRGGNGKAWAIHANSASQLWDTHSGPGSPLPRSARRWHWASAACFLLGEGPAAKGREGGGVKGKELQPGLGSQPQSTLPPCSHRSQCTQQVPTTRLGAQILQSSTTGGTQPPPGGSWLSPHCPARLTRRLRMHRRWL